MTAKAHGTSRTQTRHAPKQRGGSRTRDALWFAARINTLGLSLMALWNTLNTILLPDRVVALAAAIVLGALAVVGLIGIALAPWLLVAGVTGVCIAVGVGAFQAVNWALLSDNIPESQGAHFYGVANIATAVTLASPLLLRWVG